MINSRLFAIQRSLPIGPFGSSSAYRRRSRARPFWLQFRPRVASVSRSFRSDAIVGDAGSGARAFPHRVLEVAAGDASLCACLAARGIEVFANDLRVENLRDAVECFTVGDDVNLLPGNLFDLDPAQTGLFDLVIACEIIEHVAHTVDLLRHLKRFLTPAGRLLLTTPNGSYFRNRLPTYSEIADSAALEATQFEPDADGHLFLLTSAELRGVAEQAGLRVEQIDFYATPFITGHCLLSVLQGQTVARLCYRLEQLSQRLCFKAREKFCFLICAVLAGETSI